ncbi:MAG: DUF4093 domain-containing protein [Ruminococcus sp.]|nr:DUF4093 domain-containing protein [Ruminococcus sp.]
MLYTDKATIVEGKYDKIKLSSVIDGVIIVTNGFNIFKDKDRQQLIRFYAEKSGIIILTDSDSAGFQIRSFIKSFVDNDRITNVYIPEIFGKERRKEKPSKEGKLGVEGVSNEVLIDTLKRCGALSDKKSAEPITVLDLYSLGLVGGENSLAKRRALLRSCDLPINVSTKALLEILNRTFEKNDLYEYVQENILNSEGRASNELSSSY